MIQIAHLQLQNNIILAPMAGISDLPYRMIMKSFGPALVYTEMVSANGLIRAGKRTRQLLRSAPEERPLGIQLFGDDPAVLAEATAMVQGDGELVDLNLGCPVTKVVRSGAGSAMLRDPLKVGRAVAAMRRASALPLTVKIRSGWDSQSVNFLEVGRIAEAEGADALILHPRTRAQGFGGKADWGQIRELKKALNLPVIGSGDVFTAQDAQAMLEQTGCDGVMIGRGGYGNPWLIRDCLALQQGESLPAPGAAQRLEVALRHLQWFQEIFGPRKTVRDMRKHLCWYSRGLAGAAGFRTRINHAETLEEMNAATREFFSAAADEQQGAA
ncbi:tRNA-dihydrouridine synthase [Desulfuromonas versatilis]|uniref:tRNA-dihydrouridine synthase n=1 Tax=Desulfuromonas versatilis TaxID=2802975 RepID=A0ABN6E0L5_9BACT|nr:tRNA dihydrouridine synthase DusB [Desulfuromonas versatilis]BCR05911.1 tRNA-dihydrouridine synthase [Desulfuromonas versatilis]